LDNKVSKESLEYINARDFIEDKIIDESEFEDGDVPK
jgi:hypothetical protein